MRITSGALVRGMVLMAVVGCSGGDDGSGPPTQTQTGGARGSVLVGTAGLAGVGVSATKSGTTRQATTDASGAFSFTGLEVGSWTVAMAAPTGYTLAAGESGSRTVTVTANQVAEIGSLRLAQSTSGGGTTVDVEMRSGNTFSPSTVTIARGNSVRWTNLDQVTHNATGSGFGTGNLGNGSSSTHQFNTAGTFQYSCTLHAGMNGTVVVQ